MYIYIYICIYIYIYIYIYMVEMVCFVNCCKAILVMTGGVYIGDHWNGKIASNTLVLDLKS